MAQRSVLVVGESAKNRAAMRRLLSAPDAETYRFGEARSCASAIRLLQRQTWSYVALCEPIGEGSTDLYRFLKNDGISVIVAGATEPLPPEEALSLLNRSDELRQLKQAHSEALAKVAILARLNDAVLVTEAAPLSHPGPRILYANTAFEQMTGYSAAEIVGQTPRMLQGKLTDRRELDRVRATLEKSEPIQLELTNYRKDGAPFQVLMNILPLEDEDGKVVQFVSIQRDITEQKRILRQMQEERDRFEKMVHTSPALFCSLRQRPDGSVHFPYIGSGGRELLGFEPEELMEDASPLFARIFPEDMALIQPAIAASAKTMTPYKIQYRLRHPLRGTVWVEVHSMPVAEPDGSILWHGTATDVTERRNARQELERREAQLSGIIGSAMDAIVTIDESQKIVVFNAAAERMFRVSAAEMIGQPLERLLPERFRAAHKEYILGFGRTGVTSRSMTFGAELFGLRSDGKEFPIEATISQVEIADEWFCTVIVRDITERKRAETMVQRQIEALTKPLSALKSLPELNQFLEHLLGALTHWLEGASAALWLCERDGASLSLAAEYEAGRLQTGPLPRYPSAGQHVSMAEFPYWATLRDSRQPMLIGNTLSIPSRQYRDWCVANGVTNLLLAPMRLGDETVGVISIRNIADRFQKSEMELVQGLAQQATLAVELARLARKEQKAAILQERNRFAQDIHDTLAQGFTGILLQLEAAEYAPERNQAHVHLQQARELARRSLLEARRSVQALRPQALEKNHLSSALSELVAQVGVSIARPPTLEVRGAERTLPSGVEDRLYRIAQEALTNAIRHSDATAIHVELSFEPNAVRLTVRDNGKGFVDDHTLEEGFGLLGMHERAKEIGGRLMLVTRPGNGTTIEAMAPTTEIRSDRRDT